MLAKRFFYVCAGILCLAFAYHLGARSATAQAPGNPVVAVTRSWNEDGWVFTANGDVYRPLAAGPTYTWNWYANVFSGATTPTTQPTWGQLKARYRPGTPAAPEDK